MMLKWRRSVAARCTQPSRRALQSVHGSHSHTCVRFASLQSVIPTKRTLSTLEKPPKATISAATPLSSVEFAAHLHELGISQDSLRELYTSSSSSPSPCKSQRFPIAVALSGGADSMALMLLLNEFINEHGISTPLLAITVDHALRVESGDEARHVGAIASTKWGVQHLILQCDWQNNDHGSGGGSGTPRKSKLQEEARAFRYHLLTQACVKHGVKWLFVGHNEGDQLETVLFRLGRASGINGLAGIAAKTFLVGDDDHESDPPNSVALLRPLLSVSKASLKATCERFQQPWVEDPSNESLVFDRIRIRKALEQQTPQELDAVLAFQQIAATAKQEFQTRENELLQEYLLYEEQDLIVISTAFLFDTTKCFDELAIRLLSKLVQQVGKKKNSPPRLSSLANLLLHLRSLGSGKKITLSGCCITKTKRGRELHFQPERPMHKKKKRDLSQQPSSPS